MLRSMWFKRLGVPVLLLASALVVIACEEAADEAAPATGAGTGTGSVSAPAHAGGSVSASATAVEGPGVAVKVSQGDGFYQPVSDVDGQLALTLDARDIAAIFGTTPVDYATIGKVYAEGKNSARGDGTLRTLKGFATEAERAEEFAAAADFFASPTFLDDEIAAAIQGTGIAANFSDGQRQQVINKGVLRILYHWLLHEMNAVEERLEAGNLNRASGAPHVWDEAWAFYVGAADAEGNRPYSLAATALKREADFGKQGQIDQRIRLALVEGQQALLAGNKEAFAAARKQIESRLNALFYLATARYFNEAYKAVAAGDSAKAATSLMEGLAFYRSIQPLVAAADEEVDTTIEAFYLQGSSGPISVAKRDAALAALNRSAVTQALGLSAADLIAPSDYK